MSSGLRRFLRVVLILGAIVAALVPVFGDWASPDYEKVGYTQNPLGPVGPADRDLLYRVKQAGLWEMPVGEMANQRAVTPRLREVGAKINAEHHELDRIVTDVAAQLNVELPTEPTAEQQDWIAEVDKSQGAELDKNAVFLLRQAHGKVLPILAQVRAGTRNAAIRKLAEDGAVFVQRHINYLESTGLVRYEDLPEPPDPTPAQQPVQASYLETHDWRTLVIAGTVAAILAGLILTIARTLFAGRRSRRSQQISSMSTQPLSGATRATRRPTRRKQSSGRHAKR